MLHFNFDIDDPDGNRVTPALGRKELGAPERWLAVNRANALLDREA